METKPKQLSEEHARRIDEILKNLENITTQINEFNNIFMQGNINDPEFMSKLKEVANKGKNEQNTK